MKLASLLKIKKYFGEISSKKFAEEWKELSHKEKQYFKRAVGEEIYS